MIRSSFFSSFSALLHLHCVKTKGNQLVLFVYWSNWIECRQSGRHSLITMQSHHEKICSTMEMHRRRTDMCVRIRLWLQRLISLLLNPGANHGEHVDTQKEKILPATRKDEKGKWRRYTSLPVGMIGVTRLRKYDKRPRSTRTVSLSFPDTPFYTGKSLSKLVKE